MTTRVNGLYPGELYPDQSLAGGIDIFENAWKNPKIAIDQVESVCKDTDSGVYWQQAETVGHGPIQDMRTNQICHVTYQADLTNNSIMQNIHNQFYVLLLAASIPYAKRYGIQEELYHEQYSMLRYQLNQEYKAHYDGSTSMCRAISALCYLNDDYEGGELEFVNQKIKIKPQAGMLILFPSNFTFAHRSMPVSQGTKYAMVTWIRDREF